MANGKTSTGTGNGGIRAVADNKTVRATGRLGLGTAVATYVVPKLGLQPDIVIPVSGFIILVVNEFAYVGGLVWRRVVKKIEAWAG